MQIRIEGRPYDVAEIGRLSLLDLLELKKQTGMDVDKLQEVFADAQPSQDGEPVEDPKNILNTQDGLIAFGALIWLSRRKAGERELTFEQACDFPLDALEFVEDEDQDADPSQ